MLRLTKIRPSYYQIRNYTWQNPIKNIFQSEGLQVKLQAKKIDELNVSAWNLQSKNPYSRPYIIIEIKYLENNNTGTRLEYKGHNVEELIKLAVDDFLKSQN